MPLLSKNYLRTRRRVVTTVIVVIAVVSLIVGVWQFISVNKTPEKTTPYTADVYDPNLFALVDPDAPSIFDDDDYLSMDRSIHVRNGIEEYTVTDPHSDIADGEILFFFDYFDIISHGDYVKYEELFTDSYYEKYLSQGEFSEQRVYDIHLEKLIDSAGNSDRAYYLVTYKIAANNGSFRRDITSDSVRPVVIEIVRNGASYLINDIHYV